MADRMRTPSLSRQQDKTKAPAAVAVSRADRRIVVLAVAGYKLWLYFGSYESTDDAQIDGHVDAISARINGHVSEVLVEDAQVSNAGDTLVKIDPRDYEVALAQAEANLADAEAAFESSRTDVPIVSTNTASTLATARASRVNADAGVARPRRGSWMRHKPAWKRRKRKLWRRRRIIKKPRTMRSATTNW